MPFFGGTNVEKAAVDLGNGIVSYPKLWIPATGQTGPAGAGYADYDDGYYQAAGVGRMVVPQSELMCFGNLGGDPFPNGGLVGDDFGGGPSAIRGAYNAAHTYVLGDMVSYSGSVYICQYAHGPAEPQLPGEDPAWQLTLWAVLTAEKTNFAAVTKGTTTLVTFSSAVDYSLRPGNRVTIAGVTAGGATSALNGTWTILALNSATNPTGFTLAVDTSGDSGEYAFAAAVMRSAIPALIPWTDALALCHDLTFGGHSDWRLPNAYEIALVLTPYSSITGYANYLSWWCSSTQRDDTTRALLMTVQMGKLSNNTKTNTSYVIPVRGGRTIRS